MESEMNELTSKTVKAVERFFPWGDMDEDETGDWVRYDDFIQGCADAREAAEAERDALADEIERLRKRVKDMSSDIRIGYIHCEALAEIKATVDGKSDQPVADIISGCIAEVAAYRAILAELKGQNDE
jgi:hypothetical protein